MFSRSIVFTLFSILFALPAISLETQAQDATQDAIRRATKNLNRKQKYELRHKSKIGDKFSWATEHSEWTKTQVAGETVEQSSRAIAQIGWEVTAIDSREQITFVFEIDSVDMWQQKDEEEPISFNSKTDPKAPIEYEIFNQCVGTPVSKMIMTPKGHVLDRQDYVKQAKIGMGKMTILPLPKDPVEVGHEWFMPGSLSVKDENGIMKHLETRVHFTLDKVKDGNAYILFQTEVLTPLNSPRVRSQIMQNMTRGRAVFDIERGLVIRREVDWTETVQGFQGAGSYLKYNARYVERFIETKVAAQITDLKIKPLNGKPVFRR